jgi:hypothetical protein
MGLAHLDDIARVELFVDSEHGVGSFVKRISSVNSTMKLMGQGRPNPLS